MKSNYGERAIARGLNEPLAGLLLGNEPASHLAPATVPLLLFTSCILRLARLFSRYLTLTQNEKRCRKSIFRSPPDGQESEFIQYEGSLERGRKNQQVNS